MALTSAFSLDDARAQDPAIAGRKAAVLAELRAAGFPVLDGFVVMAGADLSAIRADTQVRPYQLTDLPGDGPVRAVASGRVG
jgi:hypothetical protein